MKKRAIRIILHIISWLLLLGLPLSSSGRLKMDNDFLLIYYTLAVINGLIFYTNYLFLVPKFFFQKKKYKYYLFVLVLVICFFFISNISSNYIFSRIAEDRKERFERSRDEGRRLPLPPLAPGRLRRLFTGDTYIIGYLSSASFMIFLSLGLRVLERQSRIEKMQEEMEKAKLNAELAFLKNQISPHFFFNTLNNIYSLISINQEDSQKAVLKLSKLMRYLLYESEQGNTRLSNEIDFMNNYIDLMKLRMNNKIELSVSFPKKYEDKNIPPLLFIPFIENAFKHGISYRKKSFIEISMVVTKESITFRCANSLFKMKDEATTGNSGIGLENASKRLNLLFRNRHDLKINKSENAFEVFLTIKPE